MTGTSEHARRVDAISWASFFIWIGVALLMNAGWALSLLGVSAIVLGSQAVLYLSGEKVEVFWVTCGIVLLASAIWLMFGLTWPLAPVLLVVLGVWMLASALFGTHAH
jgi:hypothetical protein